MCGELLESYKGGRMQLKHLKCIRSKTLDRKRTRLRETRPALRSRNIAASSESAVLLDFGTRTHQKEFAQV